MTQTNAYSHQSIGREVRRISHKINIDYIYQGVTISYIRHVIRPYIELVDNIIANPSPQNINNLFERPDLQPMAAEGASDSEKAQRTKFWTTGASLAKVVPIDAENLTASVVSLLVFDIVTFLGNFVTDNNILPWDVQETIINIPILRKHFPAVEGDTLPVIVDIGVPDTQGYNQLRTTVPVETAAGIVIAAELSRGLPVRILMFPEESVENFRLHMNIFEQRTNPITGEKVQVIANNRFPDPKYIGGYKMIFINNSLHKKVADPLINIYFYTPYFVQGVNSLADWREIPHNELYTGIYSRLIKGIDTPVVVQ